MKITILTDNSAAPHFRATHGFSCYIEADINVLFDTGPDDTFLYNAQKMNLELKPDYLVLSHGHWDHGDGLEHIGNTKLVCHPACFEKKFSKHKKGEIGIKYSKAELEQKFKINETKKPLKLSEQVWFLGEIPRKNHFESRQTNFCDENKKDDFILDDSAIVITTEKGLIVISGCAHAGICNTIDYAVNVTGEKKVFAVFGGFHLKNTGELTQNTIHYFQELNIKEVHPSHCTSLPALSEFYRNFHSPQVLAGNYYQF